MNRPVQVMLDPADRRRARSRAGELGITLNEYVRRLVREDLDAWTQEADLSVAIDIADPSSSDATAHKDRYIGEAVAARLDQTGAPR